MLKEHPWAAHVQAAISLAAEAETFGELAKYIGVDRRSLQYHCTKLITVIHPKESALEAFKREILSGKIEVGAEIVARRPTHESKHCCTCGKKLASKTTRFCNRICSMTFFHSRRGKRPQWTEWDEHFFDELTPNSAYILGLIIADGSIANTWHHERNTKSYMIHISQDEPEILQLVAEELDFKGELKGSGNSSCTDLPLGSKHAWKTLTEIYDIPAGRRKSYGCGIPEIILNSVHLPHFVRGLFDGDGNADKMYAHFTFTSGSGKLMEDINYVMVERVGLPSKDWKWRDGGYIKKDGSRSGAYYIRWASRADCVKFAKYIYGPNLDVYGSPLFLKRKYDLLTRHHEGWMDRIEARCINDGCDFARFAAQENVDARTIRAYAKTSGIEEARQRMWGAQLSLI